MLLLFLILTLTLASSSASPLVVHDVDGVALKLNTGYYMVAVTPPDGGGVTLAGVDPSRPGTCPTKLAVSSSKTDKGIPIAIVPQDPKAQTVEVGKAAQFKFSILFHCIPTTSWAVEKTPSRPRHLLPGRRDQSFDLLTINYYSSKAYSLSYCYGGTCEAVGIKREGSDWYLVLGGAEFTFAFSKYS